MLPNLFVAVSPPAEALVPLVDAVERLRQHAPGASWVDPRRWHVTICFLGPVEPTPALSERLARVARRHPPVELRVAGGGRFGNRVLWARLEGNLGPLAVGVGRAVSRAGFPVEDRPFRAHLTLARGRRGSDLRPLAAELAGVTGEPWTAHEIVLMRSGQPAYERLEAFPLQGSADRLR